MSLKSMVRGAFDRAGYTIYNRAQPHVRSEDGLSTVHVHDFMERPGIQAAYQRGIEANRADYEVRWRASVALWVARQALDRPGAFVECSVSTGASPPRSCSRSTGMRAIAISTCSTRGTA